MHVDGLMLERHNSIADALELRHSCTSYSIADALELCLSCTSNSIADTLELCLSCTNPSIYASLGDIVFMSRQGTEIFIQLLIL